MTETAEKKKPAAKKAAAPKLPTTLQSRIAAMMAEIPSLEKNKEAHIPSSGGGPGQRYSYVAHDDVTNAVRPLFKKHGIGYHASSNVMQIPEGGPHWIVLEVTLSNADLPEEKQISFWYCPIGAARATAMGGALSYATKYALQKLFLMDAGDEDADHPANGSMAAGDTQQQPQRQKPQPQATPRPQTTISPAQVRRLFALAKEQGWDGEEVREAIHAKTMSDKNPDGIHINDLPKSWYERIVQFFQKVKSPEFYESSVWEEWEYAHRDEESEAELDEEEDEEVPSLAEERLPVDELDEAIEAHAEGGEDALDDLFPDAVELDSGP